MFHLHLAEGTKEVPLYKDELIFQDLAKVALETVLDELPRAERSLGVELQPKNEIDVDFASDQTTKKYNVTCTCFLFLFARNTLGAKL